MSWWPHGAATTHSVIQRQRRAVARFVRNRAAHIIRKHFPADISPVDAGFTGLNLQQLKSDPEECFGIACLSSLTSESALHDIAEHINAVLEGATRRCVYGEDDKVVSARRPKNWLSRPLSRIPYPHEGKVIFNATKDRSGQTAISMRPHTACPDRILRWVLRIALRFAIWRERCMHT